MSEVYVAGTGSFAAEIAEYVRDAGLALAGLVEMLDPARAGTCAHGLPVVALTAPPSVAASVVIGIGGDRASHAAQLTELGWPGATVVHPTAHVSSSATLAAGAIVAPAAVVGAQSVVEKHALVGRGALVGHHTRIGRAVTLNPGANVAGNCDLGEGAFLGMGALVVPGTSVGAGAVVGAAALVLRQVAAGARVQGVPAVPYGDSAR